MSTTRNQTDKSPEVVETVQTDGFEPLHSSDVPPQKQYYTYDAEARRHRLDGGVKLRDALMILLCWVCFDFRWVPKQCHVNVEQGICYRVSQSI